jgi:hypothetical protein
MEPRCCGAATSEEREETRQQFRRTEQNTATTGKYGKRKEDLQANHRTGVREASIRNFQRDTKNEGLVTVNGSIPSEMEEELTSATSNASVKRERKNLRRKDVLAELHSGP